MYLIATRSRGKLRELRALFSRYRLDITDLLALGVAETADEEHLESYDTFEENALAKAQYFHQATGLPTFADDSGLVVDALGGRPGVRSRRWSGRSDLTGPALDEANNALLAAELRRSGAAHPWSAAYVCAAAFVDDRRTLVRTGRTVGRIVLPPRGGGGFGYDPYFESADLGATFGEAPAGAKLSVSHRGRAFGELLAKLAVPREKY